MFAPVYSFKNIDYLNDGDGLQIKRPNAELKIEFLCCELCVPPVFVSFFFKGHLQVNILYKSQSNTHLWFCHTQTQEAHEMAF